MLPEEIKKLREWKFAASMAPALMSGREDEVAPDEVAMNEQSAGRRRLALAAGGTCLRDVQRRTKAYKFKDVGKITM